MNGRMVFTLQLALVVIGGALVMLTAQQGIVNSKTILGFILVIIGTWGVTE